MSWQTVAVIVIETLAIAFLVTKMGLPKRRPRRLQKPDVRVRDLVKKRRRD